jgi:hypothetical protein
MRHVLGFDPQTIERMASEREEEQLIALQQQLMLMQQEQAAANAKSLDPNAGRPGNDDGDNAGAKAARAAAVDPAAQLASLAGVSAKKQITTGSTPTSLRS